MGNSYLTAPNEIIILFTPFVISTGQINWDDPVVPATARQICSWVMKSIETLAAAVRYYSRAHPSEREVSDRFLRLLEEGKYAFTREREEGHLTASAWVTDPVAWVVLLLHHRKLDKWLQPGGHADGDTDLLSVAMREVEEETGLSTTAPEGGRILDLDIHLIPERKGVPKHYHYDVRFLLHGDATCKPVGNHENLDVRWAPIDELEALTKEESILRMRRKVAGT